MGIEDENSPSLSNLGEILHKMKSSDDKEDRDGDGDKKLAESEKNKDGGEDVAPGSQPEEKNKGDNGDDTNKGGVPDAEIVEDHVQANKEEGDLEGETKEGDANDRKKGQLIDAEKAEDCPEGSKEQQESQLLAPAQSTPSKEEESVGDYPFLARQSTPSIPEDMPTFNLGFDRTQETVEEVTITSEDYGSFTTEDYE
ncbi:hypothetical protein E2562_022877 [Oryza meyeriana var. granulata]|uniref:Uncharacterized protein n=1 Tax=Oryza meyeriana var. granulata TaxID=110450 RepID=A0A6G1BMX8_9ORYZ|nr:hypothetical protein E2562_022877 [Oryza meyeriana var. granulata]